MMPYRIPSFRTGVRMLCGKDGKRNSDTEWRIYYAGDSLSFSSPRQQILHIRFGWRLTFPSLWRPFFQSSFWTGQECCSGKTGNGTMNRSEESITLMTSYRLPHHGRRSFFTFVQDDAFRSPSFSTFSWRLTADSSQLIADSFYLLTVFLTTAVKNMLSEWHEKMWK